MAGALAAIFFERSCRAMNAAGADVGAFSGDRRSHRESFTMKLYQTILAA